MYNIFICREKVQQYYTDSGVPSTGSSKKSLYEEEEKMSFSSSRAGTLRSSVHVEPSDEIGTVI